MANQAAKEWFENLRKPLDDGLSARFFRELGSYDLKLVGVLVAVPLMALLVYFSLERPRYKQLEDKFKEE
jgi:hypothetical protein